jgi:hypothetical protein
VTPAPVVVPAAVATPVAAAPVAPKPPLATPPAPASPAPSAPASVTEQWAPPAQGDLLSRTAHEHKDAATAHTPRVDVAQSTPSEDDDASEDKRHQS